MKNTYLNKMKACANIEGKVERKAETFKVLQEASKDENLTIRQFGNLVNLRKEIVNR